MSSQASKPLVEDHASLGGVLYELKAALDSGAVRDVYSKLDLFWARLAVHIRAEHLHLFPTILARLSQTPEDDRPGRVDGEITVERLSEDHNFFMHELARAIAIVRDLLGTTNKRTIQEGLELVREAVLEIEKQLVIHNELEENQIYRWTKSVLTEQEQTELETRINRELANRPQRFSESSWSGAELRV